VSGLAIEHLQIRYGGNVAVADATLEAPIGRITGLIGPNGAGKTSIFNACNGMLRPAGGHVRLRDRDVTRLGVARRARLGLGRTFQTVQVCTSMTVAENVALGAEARIIGGNALRQLGGRREEVRSVEATTRAALATCGIEHLAAQRASVLSTGQKRLVELARVVAGDFHVLLLDEPSSGLDEDETRRFGDILRAVAAAGEVAILLVEHDMSLVMGVCEHIYVLDFGRMVFDGTPAQVQGSSVVRAAYLGEGLDA
jgi:ABC-type branched-subunit amino acid transport system ATPase component